MRKTELLEEKEELLAEKDRQITTLKAQMSLVEEKLTQLSAQQQQQFAELEAMRKAQEDSIHGQEVHIEKLQATHSNKQQADKKQINKQQLKNQQDRVTQPVSASPMHHAAERQQSTVQPFAVKSSDIKQQVRDAVGNNVWFCLQPASQKDFQAAYKHAQVARSNGPDEQIDDYSEAGIRLSNVVEREVLHPFFDGLHSFLISQGIASQAITAVGGIELSVMQRPQAQTIGMIAPLIADQWRAFAPGQLSKRSRPEADVSIVQVKAPDRVSKRDRTLITQFLNQWEHPMASCLSKKGRQAASSLEQISKLRTIAAHPESFLCLWQYRLMHKLIAGQDGKGGLFRQIFVK